MVSGYNVAEGFLAFQHRSCYKQNLILFTLLWGQRIIWLKKIWSIMYIQQLMVDNNICIVKQLLEVIKTVSLSIKTVSSIINKIYDPQSMLQDSTLEVSWDFAIFLWPFSVMSSCEKFRVTDWQRNVTENMSHFVVRIVHVDGLVLYGAKAQWLPSLCSIEAGPSPLNKMAATLANDNFKCIFLNEKDRICSQKLTISQHWFR